jgi:glucose/mannose transport system substrate-binding protein
MMAKALIKRSMLCAGLLLSAANCDSGGGAAVTGTGGISGGGGQSGGGQSGEQLVEIFSWWIAPGEAEALQALVDTDKATYPQDRIVNSAADTHVDERAALAARIDTGMPPDLFQQGAQDIKSFIASRATNPLASLDEFMASQGLDETKMLPEIIKSVTVDGHVYALPVNIHRENALFYNKQIFRDKGLTPPTTVAEFLAVCDTLKAAGITPVSTIYQGWILRIMFNSLAMGSMGPDAFNTMMTTAGGLDPAKMMAAIDLFATVLDNYVNVTDATNAAYGWTDGAASVASAKSAMFFHGDWAKGYYEQLGFTPGVDFGVVGAPGASKVFWYGVDTFSMPLLAPHPVGARHFLSTIASKAGQVAFNKLKGSTPVRSDVDPSQLDSEGRNTLNDLQTATYRIPGVSKDAWDNAMLTFAQSARGEADKAALLQVYVDNPPVQ